MLLNINQIEQQSAERRGCSNCLFQTRKFGRDSLPHPPPLPTTLTMAPFSCKAKLSAARSPERIQEKRSQEHVEESWFENKSCQSEYAAERTGWDAHQTMGRNKFDYETFCLINFWCAVARANSQLKSSAMHGVIMWTSLGGCKDCGNMDHQQKDCNFLQNFSVVEKGIVKVRVCNWWI